MAVITTRGGNQYVAAVTTSGNTTSVVVTPSYSGGPSLTLTFTGAYGNEAATTDTAVLRMVRAALLAAEQDELA